MEERVIQVISSIINQPIEELRNKLNEIDLWDSLNKVEIIIALEDEFDISFTQEEISKINTINEACELIKGKI